MSRDWRVPDFSTNADGTPCGGSRSESNCPSRAGWNEAPPSSSSGGGGGPASGGAGANVRSSPAGVTATFRGLARRLQPFAPRSVEDLPPSHAAVRRALSRCSQAIARRMLQQRTEEREICDSSESEPTEFCRICRDGGSHEALITPCDCRGTVRFVHKTCLERWLAESDTTYCEICGLRYTIERSPRYGLLKGVLVWAMRTRHDLFVDLLTVLTFVPLAVLGTSMGMTAGRSLYYGVLSEADELGFSNLVLMMEPRVGPVAAQMVLVGTQTMTVAVVAAMAAMDFAVSAWLVLRIQQHVARCHSWYRRQCVVRLVYPAPPQPPPDTQRPEETDEATADTVTATSDNSAHSDASCSLSAPISASRTRWKRSFKET